MSKINFFALAVFSLLIQIDASAKTLNYGDLITLQNGWNNYNGGFLDTKGYQKDFEKTGNHLCVSTAISDNRDNSSGTWKVISASGKSAGTPVLIGDDVYLVNQWNQGTGGYLDTKGYQKDYAKTENHLCVSTSLEQNRDNGSGTWKILSTGMAVGTPVNNNMEIQLKNGWNNFNGGFLDTRGYQKDYAITGNHLCVSTALSENRALGSGTWKVKIKKANTNTLKANHSLQGDDILVSANGQFMLRMQEEDGNLCVYTIKDGKQGSFVWGSMKLGFKNGKLTMQDDGNLVVLDSKNTPQWASETHPFLNDKFKDANNKPVKLVLENTGKLNLYSASGLVVWTNN